MEMNIVGIKCDAEGCDFRDDFGSWGDTPEEILAINDEYLNKPCPKCGAPLLTQADHDTITMLVSIVDPITEIENALKERLGEDHPALQQVKGKFTMDGTGGFDLNIPK